jgi:hypothetical protein
MKSHGWPSPYSPPISPYPYLPISSLLSFARGLFGQERKMHRSHEWSVTRDFDNEKTEPHSKLFFPVLVSSLKLLSSLVIGCV